MTDLRITGTERSIKEAMLKLLKRKPSAAVGVTELAREAGVSRSTFYNHYSGTHEVFYALMDDFDASILDIATTYPRCNGCTSGAVPFCMRLRNAGKYTPLVADPSYLPALMMRTARNKRALASTVTDTGLPHDQAASLSSFQLAGCYTAAMMLPRNVDWEPSRRIIDHVMRTGTASLRAAQARATAR